MAVLGAEGYVRFRREAPAPIAISSSRLRPDINTLLVDSTDYWNGDEVYIVSPNGIPLSTDAVPNGVGCYFGSVWDLAANRNHVTGENDDYYVTTDDTVFFYNQGNIVNSGTYFIYRDQLGRVSFYTNRGAALRGIVADRVDLAAVDFQYLVLFPSGTAEYNDSAADCVASFGDYRFSDVTDEVTFASICDFFPEYLSPVAGTAEYDDADLEPRNKIGGFPWIIQGELREWSIDLSSENVNTTAVGQKFGESVKSVVSGGGSFDFIVERRGKDREYDATSLLQLLMLTERGAKAEAEFYMITRRANGVDSLLPGDLYYSCTVLITNTVVNTRTEGAIVGTAQFVTTGPIELKQGL